MAYSIQQGFSFHVFVHTELIPDSEASDGSGKNRLHIPFNSRTEPVSSNSHDCVCACVCFVCVCVCVRGLICLYERLCMLPGTHKSRFKAHVSVE